MGWDGKRKQIIEKKEEDARGQCDQIGGQNSNTVEMKKYLLMKISTRNLTIHHSPPKFHHTTKRKFHTVFCTKFSKWSRGIKNEFPHFI
jgi:hypothetical protein